MSEYQEKLTQKVNQIFCEESERGDWNECHQRIFKLLSVELYKSFRNGIRWAEKKSNPVME